MSFQVLPTTPHNVWFLLSILGHELTGPGRQQGKQPGFQPGRHQQRELRASQEYPVPLVTRNALQLTRFYILDTFDREP